MTILDILAHFRDNSINRSAKGTQFERLMQSWLRTDPRYAQRFSKVWLWEQFPSKKDFGDGHDVGIDLVACTHEGEYWAIQCKCYAESTTINKPDVDSFITTSAKAFSDPDTWQKVSFSVRLWIATTNHWSKNAEDAIKNQPIPVTRINLHDLEQSPVDWQKLLDGTEGKDALRPPKQLMDHQKEAIEKAKSYYANADRGKLIMACGTGKTFTSLRLIETLTDEHGLILFLVPSIALLGQALNDWMADCQHPIKAVCICSDAKASRQTSRSKGAIDLDDDSGESISVVDLAAPASTDTARITRQLQSFREHAGLVVVFSTYQSIEIVMQAQRQLIQDTDGQFGVFDFIVCDEAHRTTGVESKNNAKQSPFVMVHSNENVVGKKRLYMTATPRLYGTAAKRKAEDKSGVIYSMDDEKLYGEEFYRVNFSYAVQHGILTDYKVIILTVTEEDLPKSIDKEARDPNKKEFVFDDACKFVGVINALSKRTTGSDNSLYTDDPKLMRRALAYTSRIGAKDEPGTSKGIAATFPQVSQLYNDKIQGGLRNQVVRIQTRHVDGSMGALQRNDALAWLAADAEDPQECRIVTNVRCLSEGVDVPALDAVIFLSSRSSQVDVVQSVGRVMRSFHKGQPDEKKYGYIIIPVVASSNENAKALLDDNERYKHVWEILNALRAHDDHFNAIINQINLTEKPPHKINIGKPGIGQNGLSKYEGFEEAELEYDTMVTDQDVAEELQRRFGSVKDLYAKLVIECGERFYWENWAREVGIIAQNYKKRIERMVNEKDGTAQEEFRKFVQALQQNLNPSVNDGQAIEMLAQHIITRPIFETLFKEYEFASNNSISTSMQGMVDIFEEQAMDKDLEPLKKFYESVKQNIGQIDTTFGKQHIIKTLYERFFKGAFPDVANDLGIVYTPIECVDFIIRSVDDVLKADFGSSLTDQGVHILDPFTGTGTFITRLLQSGLIDPKDAVRKYRIEIHSNEINLLAYYVADVNIETVFQEAYPQEEYLLYDGLCLTDTFQLGERDDTDMFDGFFKENSEAVELQRHTPIKVIIGNPPYNVDATKKDDKAKQLHYPKLEKRMADTYIKETKATNKNSAYADYIKAFRWASDRILNANKDIRTNGGIVAFISNGSWINGSAQEGMRVTLCREFDKIYVFNLRGNQNTKGELSRREGGKIFDSGCRLPIAITLLVKLPQPNQTNGCQIFYHDIGDYLSRKQKLDIISAFGSISNPMMQWQQITPNAKNDWIDQRLGEFDTLIPLGDKDDKKNRNTWFEPYFGRGLATCRDAFCYNSSLPVVKEKARVQIDFYNDQRVKLHSGQIKTVDNSDESKRKLSWTRAVLNDVMKAKPEKPYDLTKCEYRVSLYRPFFRQNLLFYAPLNEMRYQIPNLFPTPNAKNLVICVCGIGVKNDFSCLITDTLPDLELIGKSQCFPLYYYQKNKMQQLTLFDDNKEGAYTRKDGITNWILSEVRSRYRGARDLTKEDIFYYVYGLLHSPEYRNRFANDLHKELPRLPIVERAADFVAFSKAGREFAALHLNYDRKNVLTNIESEVSDTLGVTVIYSAPMPEDEEQAYAYYKVDKMEYKKVRNPETNKLEADQSTLIVNSRITVTGIPAEAYNYVLNGNSAIGWLIERYRVTTDSKTGIINDPNQWAKEHKQPRYILDVLLSVIRISIETQRIIDNLPSLYADSTNADGQTSGNQDAQSKAGKPSSSPTITRPKRDYIGTKASIRQFGETRESLSLSILRENFDRINDGIKHLETRRIGEGKESSYLRYVDEQGNAYLRKANIPPSVSGVITYVPINYKTLRLFTGQYKGKRPYLVIEVLDVITSPDAELIQYRLGNILERNLQPDQQPQEATTEQLF